jgi:hypothetical protein
MEEKPMGKVEKYLEYAAAFEAGRVGAYFAQHGAKLKAVK